MLTATTLALPPRTNILRPTKKDPKDTPNCVFNKLAWHQNYGTEGVAASSGFEEGNIHVSTIQEMPLPGSEYVLPVAMYSGTCCTQSSSLCRIDSADQIKDSFAVDSKLFKLEHCFSLLLWVWKVVVIVAELWFDNEQELDEQSFTTIWSKETELVRIQSSSGVLCIGVIRGRRNQFQCFKETALRAK